MKLFDLDVDDFMRECKVYRSILEHRRNCPKWGKEFCMECFGGGLTKFTDKLKEELRKDVEGGNE